MPSHASTTSQLSYPDNLLVEVFGSLTEFNAFTKPDDFDEALAFVFSTLTEREQTVLRLRYQEQLTYRAIGEKIGCRGTTVEKIKTKAIRKMSHPTLYRCITRGLKDTKEYVSKTQHRAYTQFDEQLAGPQPVEAVMDTVIDDMGLSVRAKYPLISAHIKTLADIAALTGDDLLRIPRLGKKCAKEIIDKCATYGVTIKPPEKAKL